MIWNRKEIQEYLSSKTEEDIFEIKKKNKKSIRSLRQNNYYFWVVVPIISEFHWFNLIETHELIKGLFKIETTTWLDTWEFKWLMEQIIDMWRNRYKVEIPKPDDKRLFDYIDKQW